MNYTFEDIKNWYNRADVKFEIINSLNKREFALIVPSWNTEQQSRSTRTLKCHSVQHLDFNLNVTGFHSKQTLYNFYYSLAKYINGVPNQNFFKNTPRDNTEWKKKHYEQMTGFDLLIDIDGDSHNTQDIHYCIVSAKKITGLFNKLNVPYEIRFSGLGFHIIIPSKYMPKSVSLNPSAEKNIYKLHYFIAEILYNDYSELVDKNIYDSRRVCKIPYSLSLYEDNAYMCTPILSKEELYSFDINSTTIKNNENIRNRGIRLFNPDGNFNNLLKEMELI